MVPPAFSLWPILGISFLLASASPASEPGKTVFRAGAATSNVMPPLGISINGGFDDRQAVYVHDELHARCLVLDDGLTRMEANFYYEGFDQYGYFGESDFTLWQDGDLSADEEEILRRHLRLLGIDVSE